MNEAKITTPAPEPGLYLTIRVDQVSKRHNPMRGYREADFTFETETLADATDQRFSPSVMAATLRAIADEIDPKRAPLPNFRKAQS